MENKEFSNLDWILIQYPNINDEILQGKSENINIGDIIVLKEGFDFIIVDSNLKFDIIKQLAEAYRKSYKEDSTRTIEFDKNTTDPFEQRFIEPLKNEIYDTISMFRRDLQPRLTQKLQDTGLSIGILLGDYVYFEGFYPYSVPKYQNKNVWIISKGS